MSLYVSNRLVRMCLKDSLVLWIDPGKIHCHVGSSRPENRRMKQRIAQLGLYEPLAKIARRQSLRISNALESFAIDPDYYAEPIPFEQLKTYGRVSDIIIHRDNYTLSKWYSFLASSLKDYGIAKHKKIIMRSENDINHFMESYVLPLIDSMEKDGFDPSKGGGIGRSLIGADGSIHKSSSGRHRFYVARELGLSSFPVRIVGAHEYWYRRHIGKRLNPTKLRAVLLEVQENHA